MKSILAFFNGIREFRAALTTHYAERDLLFAYESGRDLAHRLTFRRYEE